MRTDIFCIVFFISMMRYMITALFSFNTYTYINRSIRIKNYTIKMSHVFIILYTLILSTLKYIVNGPVIPVMSTLIMFVWFWIDNKDLKQWQFPLNYALLINCVIECAHTFSYKAVQFVMGVFDITDTSEDHIYDENLLFWRATVAIVYFVVLFGIYKLKIIKTNTVKQIFRNILVSIFLISDLATVIYLKYNLKCLDDKTRLILSNIFLFFPIALLVLLTIVNKYTKKINKMKSKIKINTALEDAKKRKGEGPSGLYFTIEKHKLEMEHFEQILKELHMNLGGIGRKQFAFAGVLLKQYDNFKDVELNKNIFAPVSDIVNRTPKTVYRNIEYFIEKNFDHLKPDEVEKIYKGLISENKSAPTPAQFLFYIVQKCKEEELNDKNDENDNI